MHDTAEAFLRRCRPIIEAELGVHATYLEVGALDVNGAASYFLADPQTVWTGIDVRDGPGVDIVGDAAQVMAGWIEEGGHIFDVAVSTEGFEHMREWPRIFSYMQALADTFVVVTCAAPPRHPHGATGAWVPDPDEYYENVEDERLRKWITNDWEVVIGDYLYAPHGDLNYLLRKKRVGFQPGDRFVSPYGTGTVIPPLSAEGQLPRKFYRVQLDGQAGGAILFGEVMKPE